MRVQTFKNMKGLIHGADSKRIGCDKEGVLKIGATEVSISPEEDSILPVMFNGCTGHYNATFTDAHGNVYELDKVEIKGGRIVPPTQTEVEMMELRCRIDLLEDECKHLQEQINFLSNIFDTDSLNFLLK